MAEDTILNATTREMIALGASIAAGCRPCTAFHIKAGRAAGVCERGAALSLHAAREVSTAAPQVMAAWSIDQLGGTMELSDDFIAQRALIRALISLAAAFVMNSVPLFQLYVADAQRAGATERQIQLAVTIAENIRRSAAQKMDAAAQPFSSSDVQPDGGGCGCSG